MYINGVYVSPMIAIVLSLIENLFWINMMGFDTCFMLSIVVGRGKAAEVMKLISGSHISEVNRNMKLESINRMLSDNRKIVKFLYSRDRKGIEIYETMDNDATSENTAFLIVVSEGTQPEGTSHSRYDVYLDDLNGLSDICGEDIVVFRESSKKNDEEDIEKLGECNMSGIIRKTIKEHVLEDDPMPLKAMKVAACMLKPMLLLTNQDMDIEELIQVCEANDKHNTYAVEMDRACGLFIEKMYEFITTSMYSKISKVDRMTSEIMNNIDEYILYEDNPVKDGGYFIYLSNKLYIEITVGIDKYISKNLLKEYLYTRQIIISGKVGDYTTRLDSKFVNVDTKEVFRFSDYNRSRPWVTALDSERCRLDDTSGSIIELCEGYKRQKESRHV